MFDELITSAEQLRSSLNAKADAKTLDPQNEIGSLKAFSEQLVRVTTKAVIESISSLEEMKKLSGYLEEMPEKVKGDADKTPEVNESQQILSWYKQVIDILSDQTETGPKSPIPALTISSLESSDSGNNQPTAGSKPNPTDPTTGPKPHIKPDAFTDFTGPKPH